MLLAGSVNDGENRVFPIQVSRYELFLFLCVVIVMFSIQTQLKINAQRPGCEYSSFRGIRRGPQAHCLRRRVTGTHGNEGEENFPHPGPSHSVIFITVAVIYIFRTVHEYARPVPNSHNCYKTISYSFGWIWCG